MYESAEWREDGRLSAQAGHGALMCTEQCSVALMLHLAVEVCRLGCWCQVCACVCTVQIRVCVCSIESLSVV